MAPGSAINQGRQAMSEKPVVFDDKPGLDRILFFSDAVMACAITLLVMDLRMPEMGRGA